MFIDLQVKTGEDYFLKCNRKLEESWEFHEEMTMIRDIIALEVSFYVLFRTPFVCATIIDSLRKLLGNRIFDYEQAYGPYVRHNDMG
ncbi:hypothetical protein [Lacihabitans soyangensis]|uniref:Uncharacterized protein n=1 Tax=Lacihabitans soyangensis TaxID=869394 RepID=A0AAE3H4V5_9BACT|nr:hypothetical protein [Lacihabitans soyangensis]MCP9764953.1 hypothetical protein [Lacihabitans soyangensis]